MIKEDGENSFLNTPVSSIKVGRVLSAESEGESGEFRTLGMRKSPD